jgi:hypothetical protein
LPFEYSSDVLRVLLYMDTVMAVTAVPTVMLALLLVLVLLRAIVSSSLAPV